MTKWQKNPKTTPLKETQLELPLPPSNENTVAVHAEQTNKQIGQMLTLLSCTVSFATSLDLALQSNSATPVMVEAWSYALWAMVTHLMNTCDQLRTLMRTSQHWEWITLNRPEFAYTIAGVEKLLTTIVEDFDL